MKTSSTMVFFGATALTGAIVLGSSLPGCRDDGGSNGGSGTTSSHTGTGGGTTSDAPVAAKVVTIQQLTDSSDPNHVGSAVPVTVQGAVVMSNKFLVSKSKATGSCLWGVFLSAPSITTTGPHTGVIALSYGTPASVADGGTTAYCPVYQAGMPAGDSFPDDIAPGDVVDVTGVSDAYIYSGCTAADAAAGSSMVPSVQLNKVSTVNRTGKTTVPTPAKLTQSDMVSLSAGSDPDWLNKWGSVRVELDNVTVEAQAGGALTDNYGHMIIDSSKFGGGSNGIQVGDSVYYVGYLKASDPCYSGPLYPTAPPIDFTSITGFVYLDFCSWGIEPSNKCHDLVPPSDDCANYVPPASDAGAGDGGASDGGAGPSDAGGPLVCTH
jgi:hypothetical protein